MPSANFVIVMGNLTRDPEVKYTASGTAVCDLGVAVNERVGAGEKAKDVTTFVDVTLWGRTAEVAGEYLRKGGGVYIEGRLQLDSWEDKNTGSTRTKLKVVGNKMQMLGGKGGPPGASKPSSEPALAWKDTEPDQESPF